MGISAEPNIGWVALPVGNPGCLPTGMNWGCVRQLDDGSRMSGDVHVRFCERLGVKVPRATHLEPLLVTYPSTVTSKCSVTGLSEKNPASLANWSLR